MAAVGQLPSVGPSESIASRRFLSPLHVENSSDSIHGRLKVPGWPMTFSWSESETKRTSDVDRTEDLYSRNDERFSYSVMHDFSETSHMDYRFDLNDLVQQGAGSTNHMETASHRFLHDLMFGKNDEHQLSTNITQTNTEGDFKSSIFHWRPGWLQGPLLLPPKWTPNIKGLRLRENKWQFFVPVSKVLKTFQDYRDQLN